jgi:CheY-like chemotaxis protein
LENWRFPGNLLFVHSLLYVEDDATGAEPVALYLRRIGYDVARASNGREALLALTGPNPDLIILDVRMPKMDGLEFLAVLRSYLRWQHIPVILLTAYADLGSVTRAAERHGADVVNKAGIDMAKLAELIASRLSTAAPPALPGGRAVAASVITHS